MRPMKIASLIPATAFALALTLVSTDALAWGAQGHRLVARVAETRLTPAAQAEVNRRVFLLDRHLMLVDVSSHPVRAE